MLSCVLICTDAKKDEADEFLFNLGWGESNMGVPFSATGQLPTTHWAARCQVDQSFVTLMESSNPFIVHDFRENVPSGGSHFREVMADNNLIRIEMGE